MFAVDLDGQKGFDWATEKGLPFDRVVATGKGFQSIFWMPEGIDIRNSAGKIAEEVDIRGTGGMF